MAVCGTQIVSALNLGPDGCHEASSPLSHHHLHRPNGNMKLSSLLPLPREHRRSPSKTRSEVGTAETHSESDPVPPHLVESTSTPDLRINAPTSPMSSGMRTTRSWTIHLTSFRVT